MSHFSAEFDFPDWLACSRINWGPESEESNVGGWKQAIYCTVHQALPTCEAHRYLNGMQKTMGAYWVSVLFHWPGAQCWLLHFLCEPESGVYCISGNHGGLLWNMQCCNTGCLKHFTFERFSWSSSSVMQANHMNKHSSVPINNRLFFVLFVCYWLNLS